mgnify:FL=1
MTLLSREELWLPSNIPEWLVFALQQASNRKIDSAIDERQWLIREKIRVAPGNSVRTLLKNLGYKNRNGIYPDFQWKNILDIGWWFGWLASVLEHSVSKLTVVDPVFREADYEFLYQEDVGRLERLSNHRNFPDDATVSSELRAIREKNTAESKQVLQELLWWKEYDPIWTHEHIIRNPSYGENLEWIPEKSADAIFVNYVLSKKTVNPIAFLHEIIRVLKLGWYVVVSDNDMTNEIRSLVYNTFHIDSNDVFLDTEKWLIAKMYRR